MRRRVWPVLPVVNVAMRRRVWPVLPCFFGRMMRRVVPFLSCLCSLFRSFLTVLSSFDQFLTSRYPRVSPKEWLRMVCKLCRMCTTVRMLRKVEKRRLPPGLKALSVVNS